MENNSVTKKRAKKLCVLALFTFILSPIFAWGSVELSKETAVYASLSRMIWYSGSAIGIFLAMLVLFIPMLIAFYSAVKMSDFTKLQKRVCQIFMILSCATLYIGALKMAPSNGETMTIENVWHGILSFSGILMIFITYSLYAIFLHRHDRDGSGLLTAFLWFILISGAFSVVNIHDKSSYVTASAVSELYILSMLSVVGFLTYYLAYRREKSLQ